MRRLSEAQRDYQLGFGTRSEHLRAFSISAIRRSFLIKGGSYPKSSGRCRRSRQPRARFLARTTSAPLPLRNRAWPRCRSSGKRTVAIGPKYVGIDAAGEHSDNEGARGDERPKTREDLHTSVLNANHKARCCAKVRNADAARSGVCPSRMPASGPMENCSRTDDRNGPTD